MIAASDRNELMEIMRMLEREIDSTLELAGLEEFCAELRTGTLEAERQLAQLKIQALRLSQRLKGLREDCYEEVCAAEEEYRENAEI